MRRRARCVNMENPILSLAESSTIDRATLSQRTRLAFRANERATRGVEETAVQIVDAHRVVAHERAVSAFDELEHGIKRVSHVRLQ